MTDEAAARSAEAADVAVISPCGWGNLGDAAIVDSVVRAVRARQPRAKIVALTLNPSDTAARHGVNAFTCTGFSRPYYGVNEGEPFADLASGRLVDPVGHLEDHGGGAATNGAAHPLRWVRRAAERAPGMREAFTAASIVRSDVRHRRLLHGVTSRLQLAIVAGGGQLDQFWGGPFGHPYVLWRWAQRARSVGARYVVLSVGTGVLGSPVARMFVREALRMAEYRSFRDEGSRKMLADPRVSGDPVVPDLAYGLANGPARRPAPPRRERRLVGISPIAYRDPRVWPENEGNLYQVYIDKLTELAAHVLRDGHDIMLFATDGPDERCIEDMMVRLQRLVGSDLLARIQRPPMATHDQLFDAVSAADVVIVSRLHGALLTHLVRVPVLALSYERKVRTLMQNTAHERYCLNIEEFDVAFARERLGEMLARRAELSGEVDRLVTAFGHAVDAQYDRVVGAKAGAP
jgi:polysaccharide pyruvyl transferase WcaK-like protein